MSIENNFLNNSNLDKLNEKKRYFLDNFDILMNNFSDEIPEVMLNGSMEEKNYKVRINWFQGVVSLLDYMSDLLPKEFNLRWRDFLKNFKERRGNSIDIRTTREEIDTANNLLIEAKSYIENKKE